MTTRCYREKEEGISNLTETSAPPTPRERRPPPTQRIWADTTHCLVVTNSLSSQSRIRDNIDFSFHLSNRNTILFSSDTPTPQYPNDFDLPRFYPSRRYAVITCTKPPFCIPRLTPPPPSETKLEPAFSGQRPETPQALVLFSSLYRALEYRLHILQSLAKWLDPPKSGTLDSALLLIGR